MRIHCKKKLKGEEERRKIEGKNYRLRRCEMWVVGTIAGFGQDLGHHRAPGSDLARWVDGQEIDPCCGLLGTRERSSPIRPPAWRFTDDDVRHGAAAPR